MLPLFTLTPLCQGKSQLNRSFRPRASYHGHTLCGNLKEFYKLLSGNECPICTAARKVSLCEIKRMLDFFFLITVFNYAVNNLLEIPKKIIWQLGSNLAAMWGNK